MQFTFQNTHFRIAFTHVTETNEIPGLGATKQRSTIVRIRTGERNTTSERIVAEGKVTCFHTDNFSYEEGRKQSLILALESSSYWSNKPFRTAVWSAYRSRQGGSVSHSAASHTVRIG